MKSSEADLDPSVEVVALGTVQAAYERWAGANYHLQEQISKAEAQQTSPPIQALCANFDGQIDVTLAAVRFARVCPAAFPGCWPASHANTRLITASSATTGDTNGQNTRPARFIPEFSVAAST